MDQHEIDTMVNHISSVWKAMLKPSAAAQSFLRELRSNSDLVRSYEQPHLLEQALNVIPLQELYEKAECKCIDPENNDLDDQLAQQLLHWFKHDFFHWVDEPICNHCRGATRAVGRGQADAEELRYGAGVIELYQCLQCHSTVRFPRYNDPGKLLQTRKGRCGEWANCFTLCCRAIGLEARLVLDKTDHVWTEIYSHYQQRWIHCDACEDAFDRPMMYSVGWNKQLTYCIGFSVDEVVDVTRRYVKDWHQVKQRRQLIDEQHLAESIAQLSLEIQPRPTDAMKQRQAAEQQEFDRIIPVTQEELLGRQSGSLAWRTGRGEQGTDLNVEDPRFKDTEKRKILGQPTVDQVRLLGSAKTLDHEEGWRLTTADTSQCGGLFVQQPMSLAKLGWEVEFAFRLTDGHGGPAFGGADGLAFVIQGNTLPQLGRGGCDLGYGGIRNSLAVEFDTYDSSDRCADPSAHHISIHGRPNTINSAHHDYSLKHTSAIPAMNHGGWVQCRIRYLASIRTLEVALSGTTLLALHDLDLMAYLNQGDVCWIGFTASTGGLTQAHDLRWLSLHQYTSL